MLHLQLRAIEKTDFEQRLVKPEKQLTRLKAELEKAHREKDQERQSEGVFGKRPPQAVKAEGLNDGKVIDKS